MSKSQAIKMLEMTFCYIFISIIKTVCICLTEDGE